jgi:hypothetical protein
MDDLFASISKANARQGFEGKENLRGLRAVDSLNSSKSNSYKASVPKPRKPFRSQVNPVGTEFNPLIVMKPENLDPLTRSRCSMPERSYKAADIAPFKLDPTPKPFGDVKADAKLYDKQFLAYLANHAEQRERHIYPMVFSKPLHKPLSPSLGAWRAPSPYGRDFSDSYSLGEVLERKEVGKRINGYL